MKLSDQKKKKIENWWKSRKSTKKKKKKNWIGECVWFRCQNSEIIYVKKKILNYFHQRKLPIFFPTMNHIHYDRNVFVKCDEKILRNFWIGVILSKREKKRISGSWRLLNEWIEKSTIKIKIEKYKIKWKKNITYKTKITLQMNFNSSFDILRSVKPDRWCNISEKF